METVIRRVRAFDGWLAVALVLVPFVVAAISLSTAHHFLTYDDNALIELRTRDIGGSWPLLGPYSRFGWVHPGPLLYYLLVVPYRLLGSDARALFLAALGIDAMSVVGIVAVARRGGVVMMWATAATIPLLVLGLGGATLGDPWNPHVTLLPFLLFMLVTWRVILGSARALPVAVLIGSFLVQSHVGYTLVVTASLVAGVVGLLVEVRRGVRPTGRDVRRYGTIAVVAFLVVWLPAIVDQLFDSANLGAIVHYFTASDPTAGGHTGLWVVADQLALRPRWLLGQNTYPLLALQVDTRVIPVPVMLVPLLVAGGYAVRRRWFDLVRLVGLVVVGLGAAVIAVAQIRGTVAGYLVGWTSVLGLLAVLLPLVVLLRRIGHQRALTAVLAVATAAATVWAAIGVADAVPPRRIELEPTASSVNRVADAAARAVRGKEPVLVSSDPASAAIFTMPTLVLALERRGISVGVPKRQASWFGAARADRRAGARVELIVATNDAVDRLRSQGLQYLGSLRQRALRAAVFLRRVPRR